MAALLRQGARRIGGSVLQRTQAAVSSPAVAEERRRLLPRRMTTTTQTHEQEVRQKAEELYEVLSKVGGWENRRLLQDLAAHVEPKPHDTLWRQLRASKWAFNVVRVVAHVSFASAVAISWDAFRTKPKSSPAEKREVAVALVK